MISFNVHGGTAVDGVEKEIRYLEDDPTFDVGTTLLLHSTHRGLFASSVRAK